LNFCQPKPITLTDNNPEPLLGLWDIITAQSKRRVDLVTQKSQLKLMNKNAGDYKVNCVNTILDFASVLKDS
jgi:hypothetical protein